MEHPEARIVAGKHERSVKESFPMTEPRLMRRADTEKLTPRDPRQIGPDPIAEAHCGRVEVERRSIRGRDTQSSPYDIPSKEPPMPRILVAEDNPAIVRFLERGLRASGFTTLVAADGELAEHLSLTGEFDLLILDMGLPKRDGFHVLQELRSRGNRLPVLVLTGLPDPDLVTCLEGGADDYVTKPFKFEEVLARVRARLRLVGRPESHVLSAGAIRLDLRTRRATVDEREVELTAREFALLETLLRHPGQVLSREQLLSQVWGYAFDPGTNVVKVYISSLRKKLGDDVIETVRGMGYRLQTP
jgi:DNA-binding response OmpR family regulator